MPSVTTMRVAVLFTVVLVSGLAWARSVVTTPAGCNSEFGHGDASKACVSCVKSGGKFVQHASKKGAWACEK